MVRYTVHRVRAIQIKETLTRINAKIANTLKLELLQISAVLGAMKPKVNIMEILANIRYRKIIRQRS